MPDSVTCVISACTLPSADLADGTNHIRLSLVKPFPLIVAILPSVSGSDALDAGSSMFVTGRPPTVSSLSQETAVKASRETQKMENRRVNNLLFML